MTGDSASSLRNTLPYRPCVGIVLINQAGLIFTARRRDTPDAWQMPQGGIDPGESIDTAAHRELLEETGIEHARIIDRLPDWVTYDLPDHLVGKIWGGRYRGQKQMWVAMTFDGDDHEIDLAHHAPEHTPEFDAWRWSSPDSVLKDIVPFKRDVYGRVLDHFRAHFAPR